MGVAKLAIARDRAHAPRWVALPHRRDPAADDEHLFENPETLEHR